MASAIAAARWATASRSARSSTKNSLTKIENKGKGKAGKPLDYAGVVAEAKQPTAAPPATQTAEEEWLMGATYCVVKEHPAFTALDDKIRIQLRV